MQGFRYCDLLLSQGDYAEVERRASQTLEWYSQTTGSGLLETALDNLSLGRAQLLHFQHDPNLPIPNLLITLNRAVDGLRQSGRSDILPRGLLARCLAAGREHGNKHGKRRTYSAPNRAAA